MGGRRPGETRGRGVVVRGIVAGAAATLVTAVVLAAVPAVTSARPSNVVFVFTDDQDARSFGVMRRVQREIARRGTTFNNALATFPLCCPSRASFLTGQYSHNHGVLDNEGPKGGYRAFREGGTLPVALDGAGYRTGYFGKYLNGYGPRAGIPSGWDQWFVRTDGRYYHWQANDNGRQRSFGGSASDYSTDVVSREARRFVRRSVGRRAPFFLTVSYAAPHGPPQPAHRHRDRFRSAPLPRPPSFNEADITDKPKLLRRASLERRDIRQLTALNRGRRRTLLAVDQGIGQILDELRPARVRRNTLVIFTTDNGFLLGEHRLRGKPWLYEESIGTPLYLRGPGFPTGVQRRQLVGNIDVAPTILQATGARALRTMDGRPLGPLARDPSMDADRSLLIQNQVSAGVRAPGFMYAEHPEGQTELYDLTADPYQLENVAGRPEYGAVQASLADRLRELRRCSGAGCR